MSKKQVLLLSLVTAIPGGGLLYFLVMAAINHGSGVFGGLMWLFWGAAALGAAIVTVAPILIGLLYPAAGLAGAVAGAAGAAGAAMTPLAPGEAMPTQHEDDDDLGDELVDDGEQLFDEDALDDDFDDDFDGDFEDDDEF